MLSMVETEIAVIDSEIYRLFFLTKSSYSVRPERNKFMKHEAEMQLWYRRVRTEYLKGTPPAEALKVLRSMLTASDAVRA
jgi:hypothetical protein